MSKNKLFFFFVLLLFLLLLRDLPYVNILFIDQLWIIYAFILVYVLLPRNLPLLIFLLFFFLIASLIFMLSNFAVMAEALGIVIFGLLCVIMLLKVLEIIKK